MIAVRPLQVKWIVCAGSIDLTINDAAYPQQTVSKISLSPCIWLHVRATFLAKRLVSNTSYRAFLLCFEQSFVVWCIKNGIRRSIDHSCVQSFQRKKNSIDLVQVVYRRKYDLYIPKHAAIWFINWFKVCLE